MQRLDLDTCTIDELKKSLYGVCDQHSNLRTESGALIFVGCLDCRNRKWSKSTIIEALGIIRATEKKYGAEMNYEKSLDMIRKRTVVENPMRIKLKKAGYKNSEIHGMIEKLIGGHNPRESALKIRGVK